MRLKSQQPKTRGHVDPLCHTSKQKFEKKFARISFGSKNGGNQPRITAFHLYLCSFASLTKMIILLNLIVTLPIF